MKEEQEIFVNIINDHIYGRYSSITKEQVATVSPLAHNHQLTSIVYYQCKSQLLRSDYLLQISDYCKRRKEVNNLDDILIDIQHIYFKGIVVSNLYPQPSLRSMGDIDILIHENNRQAVHERLLSFDYKLISNRGVVWAYQKTG